MSRGLTLQDLPTHLVRLGMGGREEDSAARLKLSDPCVKSSPARSSQKLSFLEESDDRSLSTLLIPQEHLS